MTIKASNTDVNLLQVGRLEDSSSVSSLRVAWDNYETSNKKLHTQTPAFITETYGIPREGPYYQNDKQEPSISYPSAMVGRSTLTKSITLALRSSTTRCLNWTSTLDPRR